MLLQIFRRPTHFFKFKSIEFYLFLGNQILKIKVNQRLVEFISTKSRYFLDVRESFWARWGLLKLTNWILILIPYCRNSKFFHCEPTLQLLIFCTIIQTEQKVPIEAKKNSKIHATKPPLRSVECKCRRKLVLEIKLHRDIFDFFACEGQSSLVSF